MIFSSGQGIYQHIGNVDQAEANEIVKASMDAGVNFFDTADLYSRGESETTPGQALQNLNIARKDVVLATKVHMRMGQGRNDAGASDLGEGLCEGRLHGDRRGSAGRCALDRVACNAAGWATGVHRPHRLQEGL